MKRDCVFSAMLSAVLMLGVCTQPVQGYRTEEDSETLYYDGFSYRVVQYDDLIFAEITGGADKAGAIEFPEEIDGYWVRSIGENAFTGNQEITSVQLPQKMQFIEKGAFQDCTGLETVTAGSWLTAIYPYTFAGCINLKTVSNVVGLERIANHAFQGCEKLENFELSEFITQLGSYCFEGCSSLRAVTIPEEIQVLQEGAFYGCTNLADVEILNKKIHINGRTFTGTAWLAAQQEKNPFVMHNGILIDGTACAGDVIIPPDIKEIGSYAFEGNSTMESIDLGHAYPVGLHIFKDCTALKRVKLPDTPLDSSNYEFENCPELEEIVSPTDTLSIGYTLSDCEKIQTLELPKRATHISKMITGCSNLKSITIPETVVMMRANCLIYSTGLEDITILNPSCKFGLGICRKSVTLHGYSGSTTEEYAKEYGLNFVDMGEAPRMRYDMDGNGAYEVADVVLLSRLLAEDTTLDAATMAEALDETVTVDDLRCLIKILYVLVNVTIY